MRLGSRTRQVTLEVREAVAEDAATPADVRLSAAVRLDGFRGTSDTLWISRGNAEQFIGDLQRLEASRHGRAELRSISEDFVLVLELTDPATDVLATVSLCRDRPQSGRDSLHGTIHIEQERLQQTVDALRRELLEG